MNLDLRIKTVYLDPQRPAMKSFLLVISEPLYTNISVASNLNTVFKVKSEISIPRDVARRLIELGVEQYKEEEIVSEQFNISVYWSERMDGAKTVSALSLKPGRVFDYHGYLYCDECSSADCHEEEKYMMHCSFCLGSGTNRSCFDE